MESGDSIASRTEGSAKREVSFGISPYSSVGVRGPGNFLDLIRTFYRPFGRVYDGRDSDLTLHKVIRLGGRWRLLRRGDLIAKSERKERLFVRFMGLVTERYLQQRPAGSMALHAAGFVRGDRAVLITGPRDGGHTTVVQCLFRKGLRLLTDAVLLICPDTSRIHPFPRPIELGDNPPTHAPFETFSLTLREDVGCDFGIPLDENLPQSVEKPDQILVVRLNRTTKGPDLRPMEPDRGLRHLFSQTHDNGSSKKTLPSCSTLLRDNPPVHQLDYQKVENAVAALNQCLK